MSYLWTRDELRRAVRRHNQAQLRPGLALAFGSIIALVAVFACVMLVIDGFETSLAVMALLMLAFVTYWLFLRRRLNEWGALRGFDALPGANEEVRWEFSKEAIAYELRGVLTFTADWKVVSKVVEAGDGFLFYTFPRRLFYWIPFSGFEAPNAIDGFRELIREQVIEFVRLSRRTRS